MTLEKEKADVNEEKIKISDCKMIAVDIQGWTDDQLYGSLDRFLFLVHQSASHGSG